MTRIPDLRKIGRAVAIATLALGPALAACEKKEQAEQQPAEAAPAAQAPAEATPAPAEKTETPAEAGPAAEAPAEAAPPTEAPAEAAPAPAEKTEAPAPAQPEQAKPEPAPAAEEAPAEDPHKPSGDPKVFTQADGREICRVYPSGNVNYNTYLGFAMYHAVCHTCHGRAGMGSSFGPALVESLKSITYEDFVEVVMNGRENVTASSASVMPSFGDIPKLVNNIDNLYGYLKCRSEGHVSGAFLDYEGEKGK